MRSVAGIMLLLLAACQSPSGMDGGHGGGATHPGPSTPSESESLVDLSTPISEWVNTNIAKGCGVVTVTSGDAECARHVLLAAFDTTGEARSNCPGDMAIDLFAECVVYGSMAYDLLDRADAREEASFDWQAPVTSLHSAFATLVYRNGMGCYGQEPSTLQSCYRREATRSLGLSETFDTICGGKEEGQWNQCILGAFLANELQEASLRI